jgi:hypothetical protein
LLSILMLDGVDHDPEGRVFVGDSISPPSSRIPLIRTLSAGGASVFQMTADTEQHSGRWW